VAEARGAEEEIERVVRVLWPQYGQLLASLERRFEKLSIDPVAPDDDDFLELARENVEVARLAAVLFDVTGDIEFRRPFDAVRALKSFWFDVNRDRERLFLLIGPGSKPRLGEVPWMPAARRLAELRHEAKAVAV
jgi:hypothetical protein